MQCTSCGTPIPQGAKHCPLCGTPTYNHDIYQETVHSSPIEPVNPAGTYSPGTFQEALPSQANSPSDRTIPADTFPPGWRSTPPPDIYTQSPYESTQLQHQSYTPEQQPFPSYEPTFQQQIRYVAAPPTYNQQPPFIPPTKRPGRRLSLGFVILLVLLALLLMLSGFGLLYYSTVYQPNQLHAQGTATAQTMQTRITRATTTANAQVTGTAVAVVNATATANAVATANVVGTATALQSIYTHATSGNPALNESLSGNTGSNWDVDQAQGGGGCGFNGGSYRASIYSKGFYFSCFAQNTNFSNFAFQVQMNITRGDSGGLIFRGKSSANKFYAFQVGQDGSYDLFASQDRTHSSDLLFGNSLTIKKNTGQTNLVTIIAEGGNISFYINKHYTGSVSDGTFKSGQIGLFALDHTNPTDVSFSNLRIWQL